MFLVRLVLQGIEEFKEVAITYKGSGAAPYIIKFLGQVKNKRSQLGDSAAVQAVSKAIQEINDAPNN
jgi:hypothetical protein